MLFKPKWASTLPVYLRPDNTRIKQLEKLRVQFEIPHEAMMMRVAQSKTTTRKAQRDALELYRRHSPTSSEKELLKMVLLSRLRTDQLANRLNLPTYSVTEKDVDKVMESINSFDDLVNYIIGLDEQEPSLPDPIGLGKQIDEILEQETID